MPEPPAPHMPPWATRYRQLAAEVARVATLCGRAPRAVRLVVACKHQPAARLADLFDAGARDFGESRADELLAHQAALAAAGRVARWHFVGRLQGNKAARVAAAADVVHSVDRASLLAALGRHAQARRLPVLLQVNLGDEPQKGGVAPAALGALLAACRDGGQVVPQGLMAVPPRDDPAAGFARLAALAAACDWPAPPELSMGMSDDWPTAVAHGATYVRIGRAIFGPRARA